MLPFTEVNCATEGQIVKFDLEKFVRNSATIIGWDVLLLWKPVILAAQQKCVSCLFAILFSSLAGMFVVEVALVFKDKPVSLS